MNDELLKQLAAFSSGEALDRKASIKPLLSSREDCELEVLREEVKLKKEAVEGAKQDREQRKALAWAIYCFVVSFVAIVLAILCLSAFECVCFTLSDPVLIALITTMTTTIVGLLVFVLKYFFPQDKGS